MPSFIKNTIQYYGQRARIRNTNLPNDFKSKILATHKSLNANKKNYQKNKKAIVCGMTVDFFDFNNFMCLFGEIFAQASYRFSTNSEVPFIVDCGANIGMSIIFFKCLFPNASILGFEADPATYACLSNNITQNNLKSVSVENCALCDKEGETHFFTVPDKSGGLRASLFENDVANKKQTVKCGKLSTYISQPIDFLKIDIEGAEKEVFADLNRENKLQLIDQMLIEYHHFAHTDKNELPSLLQILEKSGFVYQISGILANPLQVNDFQDLLIFAQKQE